MSEVQGGILGDCFSNVSTDSLVKFILSLVHMITPVPAWNKRWTGSCDDPTVQCCAALWDFIPLRNSCFDSPFHDLQLHGNWRVWKTHYGKRKMGAGCQSQHPQSRAIPSSIHELTKRIQGHLQRDSALQYSSQCTEEQDGGSFSDQHLFSGKQEHHGGFVLQEHYWNGSVGKQRKRPTAVYGF